MIVATAGHVDHGKTSLVRALTGVDTDRLDEEKRRGLTIDIGFAYADLGGPKPTGFVDVPGHERFVRNMLAGINAIDLAMLVVAADDGPMPQTREHLAILDLLGAASLIVVLTKIDRASETQRASARAAITALMAGSRFADAPLFEVATPTGNGLASLREFLAARAQEHECNVDSGGFRLAIDRAFSVSGAGLVVTGAVISGEAAIGDAVVVSPIGRTARVRQIHAQGKSAQQARAGERCALNLSGPDLHRDLIGRGQWVVTPFVQAPAQRIDLDLQMLPDLPRAVRTASTVQVHAGAASTTARLHTMGARDLAPGSRGFAQLVLDTPLPLAWGDRLVIRDAAARLTLGGGRVLDPFASARGRSGLMRQKRLRDLSLPDPAEALRSVLADSPLGLELNDFERSRNLTAEAAVTLRHAAGVQCAVATSAADRDDAGRPPPGIGLSVEHWSGWQQCAVRLLAASHADQPERIGLKESELARQTGRAYLSEFEPDRDAGPHRIQAVAGAAIRAAIASGDIARDGPHLRCPGHRAVLNPHRQALLDRVKTSLAQSGLRAPIVGELGEELGMQRADLLTFLREMAGLGHLLPVAPNRFYLPHTLDELAAIARKLAATSPDGSFDAAAYRDASGIGRNLTIEVLEYLDRSGITRFAGNRRVMRT